MREKRNLQNCFLVASPAMVDPNFAKTVVYVAGHNSEAGAIGVVVNRRGNFPFSEACEQLNLKIPEGFGDFTFGWGGPVKRNTGYILHSPEKEFSVTLYRGKEIALSVSPDVLAAYVNSEGAEKNYMVLGCAAWDAGQLEQEIEAGAWYVIEANPRLIFDVILEDRYELALGMVDAPKEISTIDGAFLSDHVGHA